MPIEDQGGHVFGTTWSGMRSLEDAFPSRRVGVAGIKHTFRQLENPPEIKRPPFIPPSATGSRSAANSRPKSLPSSSRAAPAAASKDESSLRIIAGDAKSSSPQAVSGQHNAAKKLGIAPAQAVPEDLSEPRALPNFDGMARYAAALESIQVGTQVRVEGLTFSADLNGATGQVVAQDHANQRYHVQLSNGEVKSVRSDNLVAIDRVGPGPWDVASRASAKPFRAVKLGQAKHLPAKQRA
eukprot:gnl/TRDRNA2_/TRDRNA2_134351_c0_seq1.p1 gnl/TRDRNA2_/TRDRNA2_134351_c0~~gnl/TRDRNA2_/TRDRNA2_134351_c0_seq1.p1  ORF type:complete len:263 (-),score=40.32 gnl/TRDRNA2_/TRDRNA2_134351_c0_seq1:135-854(-)